MRVYSTLHRSLVELVPATPGQIGLYVCGATVQSEPHVGHGRYAVVFDMIRRYLQWRGNHVTYVRNITDIDDKIIAAAAAAGEEVGDRARRIASVFATAYEALGVSSPDYEPKATEHIPEMVELIGRLIDRGLAYRAANGDVYFSVRALESYGKLSGRRPDELRAGARIEVSEDKVDPLDFALWKSAKPGEPYWDSPWGAGRPGWHIECSAMASRYLGADFTIHGGGADLIFPHHENEIAQSEGASGTTFARYWLHNGMLNLGGEKMSKSTGLVVDLTEAIRAYGGMALRLFYLRAHYRSPLDYTEELVLAAASAYDRVRRLLIRAPRPEGVAPDPELMARFVAAMDEDFGTPEAVAIVFAAVADANRSLDQGGLPAAIIAAVHEMITVLGFAVV
ncbi:MAG TPA: cysteine--tRNA ligase, partial [Acidimicrobiia bacterium]|nr:cysteine--tRNA ligase [Acidimicrobiia bacterium]